MLEKNRESQSQSVAELQQELKSLKALLLARPSPSIFPAQPSSALPAFQRPSIPAWQLATTTPAPVPQSATATIPQTVELGISNSDQ